MVFVASPLPHIFLYYRLYFPDFFSYNQSFRCSHVWCVPILCYCLLFSVTTANGWEDKDEAPVVYQSLDCSHETKTMIASILPVFLLRVSKVLDSWLGSKMMYRIKNKNHVELETIRTEAKPMTYMTVWIAVDRNDFEWEWKRYATKARIPVKSRRMGFFTKTSGNQQRLPVLNVPFQGLAINILLLQDGIRA